MIATSSALIERFQEDCNLRGIVSSRDYIYRAKEYCIFLEARGKNPLTADREDLRASRSSLHRTDHKHPRPLYMRNNYV